MDENQAKLSVKNRGENLNISPTEKNSIFSGTDTKSEWQHLNPQHSKPKSKSFNKVFLKLTIIPIVVLSIFAYFSFDNESWVVAGLDHFYFEMISVILSFLVAFYCIIRGYVLKDKLSLFLGLGFHVAGVIDLLHGSFAILNLGHATFEGYFIPQTWVAGRLVMGVVMMLAIAKFSNSVKHEATQSEKSLRKEVLIYTLGLTAFGVLVTFWSIIQPFPFVTIDFIIKRPYEIAAALFFLTAIVLFYKNRLYKISDKFFNGILLSLVIDLFVNLIISQSSFVFDAPFNLAHALKNVSYFVLIVAIAISVSERYKIQKHLGKSLSNQLKETKDLQYALDESSIVSMTDKKDKITYVNDKFCEISKYSREELMGQNHSFLKSGYHPDSFYTGIWNVISNGRIWRGDIKQKAKDGSHYWVRTVVTPFLGNDGKPQQYITIRTDITSQKGLEENLDKKVKERTRELKKAKNVIENQLDEIKKVEIQKEEFTAMVSHELKTPVTPIMMWSDALKDPDMLGKLNEKQTEAVNKISSSAEQLKILILDIFDAYKLDLNRMSFNYSKFEVLDMMESVYQNAKKLCESKGIKLVNSTLEHCTINSDHTRIIQILRNLISNSIDFVPKENGGIEINFTQKDDSVIFYVKDNGVGIPLEKQQHLFNKFYQVDSTLTREHGGTGLGLAICRGISEGLEGKIWVESEEGKGSTFFVKIPKQKKSLQPNEFVVEPLKVS